METPQHDTERYDNMKNLFRTLAVVTCAASLMLGCNQPQPAKTKTTEKTEKAASVGTKPEVAKSDAGGGDACSDYSTKFCEAAGGDRA